MNKTQAGILLTLVFAARGTSFLFSKELMNSLSPMSILAVRFLLAFLILAMIFFKRLRACDRRSLRGGVILGVLYTVCMTFEMFGLREVDTGTSALIENMAIVLVPLYIAALTRTAPKLRTLLCAVVAVIGVGFLSVSQVQTQAGGLGLFLIIMAALTYGVCIVATEKVSRDADPIAIGIIQLGVMGALSLLIALPSGGLAFPQSGRQWLLMLLLVLVCSCFGFAFQPVGQKAVSSEAAAIFTVVNPLTASALGLLVAGEEVTLPKMIGYVLIIAALLLYNIHPRKREMNSRS